MIIGAQISGDVLHNPGLGYAMAMGMVLIMAVALIFYSSSSGARSAGADEAQTQLHRVVAGLHRRRRVLPAAAVRHARVLAAAKPPFAAYTNSFTDPKFFRA